jgi:hypothetical protein
LDIAGQEYAGSNTCPTCGQSLPESQVQAAIEKHNTQQAAKLAEINERGRKLKDDVEKRLGLAKRAQEKRKADLEANIKVLEAEIDKLKAEKPLDLSGVGQEQAKEIEALRERIEAIDKSLKEAPKTDTGDLELALKAEQTKLADIVVAKKTQVRIETLTAEEKRLAAEYERLEHETFLMEKFEYARANLLEAKVASKFKVVNFKLFKQNINGSIEPCCETTVDGVPWDSVNTGSQIFGGLDIILTLQNHYGVKSVVFLDHFEALSSPPPDIGCQMIYFKVSEDKELKAEISE